MTTVPVRVRVGVTVGVLVLYAGVQVGGSVMMGAGVQVGGNVMPGAGVFVGRGVHVGGRVMPGAGVMVGGGVQVGGSVIAGVGVGVSVVVIVAVGVSEGGQVSIGVFVGRGVRVGTSVGGASVEWGVWVDGKVVSDVCVGSRLVGVDVCPTSTVGTSVGTGPNGSNLLSITHQMPTTATHMMPSNPATRPMLKPDRRLVARCDGGAWACSSLSPLSLCSVSSGIAGTSGSLALKSGCMNCSPDAVTSLASGASGRTVANGDVI